MNLTDSQIKSLEPETKARKVSDGGGLFVHVSPKGSKTFRATYRFGGKQPTLTLGSYPALRLSEARRLRDRIRLAISEGQDPKNLPLFSPHPEAPATKPGEESDQPTVVAEDDPALWANMSAAYFRFRKREGMDPKTEVKLSRHLKVIDNAIGHKILTEITAQDLLAMVRPVEDRGNVETAHELRSRCNQIFEFAEGEGYENSNPARRITKSMVKRRRGKFPGVTEPREVGKLMRAIRGYDAGDPQIRIGLMLSAYLFPRNTQLRGMCWSEIDLRNGIWEIPAKRMKGYSGETAFDQIVPLPRQAVSLLAEARQWSGDGHYVLPSPRGKQFMLSDPVWNMALRRLGYNTQRQHCHHGFRTTASTNLNELGFNRDWIERQLAHVERGVRGTYNKAQYLEGRCAMMQTYADWLDKQADNRD